MQNRRPSKPAEGPSVRETIRAREGFVQRMDPVTQGDMKEAAAKLNEAYGRFVVTPSASNYYALTQAMKFFQSAKYGAGV